MKIVIPIVLLSFFIACESPCWRPACQDSTVFRFSLLDSAGNDLFFGDSARYSVDQLQIKDSLDNSYPVEDGNYSPWRLVVTLSRAHTTYEIILQDSTLDFFTVTYELVEEECCGLTPWARQFEFTHLRTAPADLYSSSTNIYLD